MNSRFPKARFKPWVGPYYKNSPLGLRLLILGESHYRSPDDKSPEEWTTIEALKQGRHTYRYWTRLSGLVGGYQPPHQVDIWDSVVFYNYVQHVVGTEPRQRPSERMWTSEQTLDGFREVLRVANPERILVVGKRNWEMMAGGTEFFPKHPPIPEEKFKLPRRWRDRDGVNQIAYWYSTTAGHYALCAPIYHPAYPKGFHSDDTSKIVALLLRKDWETPKSY
jgi:hypothetical protein